MNIEWARLAHNTLCPLLPPLWSRLEAALSPTRQVSWEMGAGTRWQVCLPELDFSACPGCVHTQLVLWEMNVCEVCAGMGCAWPVSLRVWESVHFLPGLCF